MDERFRSNCPKRRRFIYAGAELDRLIEMNQRPRLKIQKRRRLVWSELDRTGDVGLGCWGNWAWI